MNEINLEAVRAALGTRNNARGYRMFSKDARDAAVEYARARMSAGATIDEVLAELGLNDWTLKRWLQLARRRQFRASKRAKGFTRLTVSQTAARAPGMVVSGPCGLRVEGLQVDDVVELMKKLSCLG